jgi:hypothetical protein
MKHPEVSGCLANRSVEHARSTGVGANCQRLGALRVDLGRECAKFGLAPRQQHDIGSFRGETPRGGGSYAAAGTDDQNNLVAKSEVHVRS